TQHTHAGIEVGWERLSIPPSPNPSGRSWRRRTAINLGLRRATMSEIDLERALNDPADLFESPDAVLDHPGLIREQKIHILRNWQLDASRLEGSEGEGMRGEA